MYKVIIGTKLGYLMCKRTSVKLSVFVVPKKKELMMNAKGYKIAKLLWVGLAVSSFAKAEIPKCYELSPDGVRFSKSPEYLCVEHLEQKKYKLQLVNSMVNNRTVAATFNYDVLYQVKCINCNKTGFGIAIPSNTLFNQLKIDFDGHFDDETQLETGTVSVGPTKFYYRLRGDSE